MKRKGWELFHDQESAGERGRTIQEYNALISRGLGAKESKDEKATISILTERTRMRMKRVLGIDDLTIAEGVLLRKAAEEYRRDFLTVQKSIDDYRSRGDDREVKRIGLQQADDVEIEIIYRWLFSAYGINMNEFRSKKFGPQKEDFYQYQYRTNIDPTAREDIFGIDFKEYLRRVRERAFDSSEWKKKKKK